MYCMKEIIMPSNPAAAQLDLVEAPLGNEEEWRSHRREIHGPGHHW
jgi:hypothetical protein